jgi:hypothetical protein
LYSKQCGVVWYGGMHTIERTICIKTKKPQGLAEQALDNVLRLLRELAQGVRKGATEGFVCLSHKLKNDVAVICSIECV